MKIRVFQLPEKGRQGAARNLGIKESKGEYIGFVDSDDCVDSAMYETLYNLANGFKVDMSYGSYYENFGNIKSLVSTTSELGKEESRVEISKGDREAFMVDMLPFWCCIFKSELLKSNNIYFPEQLAYEDNYFGTVVRYFIKSFSYTRKPLYYYNRANIESTTNQKNSIHHMDRIKTADMTLRFFKRMDDYDQIKRAVEYIYLEHFYIHTVSCLIYYYDKTDYKLIRNVRDKFIREFPEYKHNSYYVQKFGRIKRAIFQINEWSPFIYVNIYRLFRILNRKR